MPLEYRVVDPKNQIDAVVAVPRPGFALEPYSFSYAGTRNFEWGDFNGDGLPDLVVAPQSFQPPVEYFAVEFWLNNGDQSFRKATAEVVDGPVPRPIAAEEVFVRDFNEDGRPDVLVSDSGIEFPQVLADSGGQLTLMLSQPNGKLSDASHRIVPNPKTFHHGAGVGDFNGDGHLDVAVNRFSSAILNAQGTPQKEGVALLLGNGAGDFVESTEGLPHEIRFMFFVDRVTNDYQVTGCTTLARLDHDDRDDLVAGTYTFDHNQQKTRTLRFFKSMPGAIAVEAGRTSIPPDLADIGYGAPTIAQDPDGRGLGCPQVIAGDINGDGLDDLVVAWEGVGKTYFQVLRNDGNFQFTDTTASAVGYYSSTYWNDGNADTLAGRIRLIDLNGDGALDLAFLLAGRPQALLQHAALLNDGTGKFTPYVPQKSGGPVLPEDILSYCTTCNHSLLFMPTLPGDPPSWVFKEVQTDVDAGPPMQSKRVTLTVLAPVLPTISVANASTSEGDAGTKQASFTVSLSGPSAAPVSFDAFTAPGTAAASVDYTSQSVNQVIPAGQTSANVPVTVHGDTLVEGHESFTVNLANVVGARFGKAQALGRILNDDLAQLSIADASVMEGQSGETTMSFVVTLSRAMPSPVFFDIATSNGTATAGSDYVTRSQAGRFLDAGRTRQVFEVAVKGDATTESNETFSVTLSNVNGAIIGDAVAVGTILNDDAAAVAPTRAKSRRAVRPAP